MEELRHLKVKEIKNMEDMDARQHEAHLRPKLTIENGIEEYRDDLPPDYSRQGPEEHPWSDRVAAELSAILSDYWKQLPLNPEGAIQPNDETEVTAFIINAILDEVENISEDQEPTENKAYTNVEKPGTPEQREAIRKFSTPNNKWYGTIDSEHYALRVALHRFPGLNKQNAIANKMKEVETRSEEAIHNGRADIQWAWAAVMIAIVKRHATWSRTAKKCGEEVHSVPYDKIKWTGRKDRARLYEAHEVDFNYRGNYEVLKFPADMHVRVAKIMEAEFYFSTQPRNTRHTAERISLRNIG
jgi:hypothetical protein